MSESKPAEALGQTYEQPLPVCPHCGYAMNGDDMYTESCCSDADLWAIAPKEDRAIIKCPCCDKEYWVQGGYRPLYTTAFSEEELDDL